MGARKHRQEEAFDPFRNVVKCFCALVVNSKTLSRRIIYALFSQPVVSFWGLCPRPPHASAHDVGLGMGVPHRGP